MQKDTARREVVCYNYPIRKCKKKGPDFTPVLIFLEPLNQLGIITQNTVSNMIPSAQENSKNNFYFFEV